MTDLRATAEEIAESWLNNNESLGGDLAAAIHKALQAQVEACAKVADVEQARCAEYAKKLRGEGAKHRAVRSDLNAYTCERIAAHIRAMKGDNGNG
jgi:hypothetical protein